MNASGLTAKEIRQSFHAGLKEMYDADEINSIIYLLFEEFVGWSKTMLHLEPGKMLAIAESARFSDALARLAGGCPVQYITGKASFNELQFGVNPSVLIPRPETAELAALLVQTLRTIDLSGFSAMDLGTGSGCLAIYLKKHLPAISMHGIDISEEALVTARSNARLHETEINFCKGDILHAAGSFAGKTLNLVVSNPPYVTMKEKHAMKQNVRDYEPHSALFVPDETPLLYYRSIAGYSKTCLANGGLLYLEINEAFGQEMINLLDSSGFRDVMLMKDFRGRDRFIKAGISK